MAGSTDLFTRIVKNDRTAIEDCIDAYGKMIWSMSRRYKNSPDDAEAVTRAIFLDIWRSAGTFDSSGLDEIGFISVRPANFYAQRVCATRLL